MGLRASWVRDRVEQDVTDYLASAHGDTDRARAAAAGGGLYFARMVDQWLAWDTLNALRTVDLRRYQGRRDDSTPMAKQRARVHWATKRAREALAELGDALAALYRAERDWRG